MTLRLLLSCTTLPCVGFLMIAPSPRGGVGVGWEKHSLKFFTLPHQTGDGRALGSPVWGKAGSPQAWRGALGHL